MAYQAEISRANPSSFLFLIDQSGSMADPFPALPGKRKADGVADAINRLLNSLVDRCTKGETVWDYFHVGVIGYGSGMAAPALGGALAGRRLVPLGEIAEHPLRLEERTKLTDNGAGGKLQQTVKFPVWFESVAHGKTPTCAAFDLAWEILADFLVRYPQCFPPVVINITDGEASDGDPAVHAQMIRDLASADGNVLLFNVHISSRHEQPLEFPDREAGLPDEPARRLFRMSSKLPAPLLHTARREGIPVTENTCGFIFNANLGSIIRFLEIGTRVDSKNLR